MNEIARLQAELLRLRLLGQEAPDPPKCRGCSAPLDPANVFCDLGYQPLANALLTREQLDEPEVRYPTRPLACCKCLLVQLPFVPTPSDLFPGGYPFFSGASHMWQKHSREYADMIIERRGLGATSRVIEIGSNDGTMLRRFRGVGIPAVGIEPCERLAEHAQMEGLSTICAFWSERFAHELAEHYIPSEGNCKSGKADLVIANNVLAHVPDLGDFLRGVRAILAPGGVATFEVPYIGNLIRDVAFDQVYAEHHCYFSMHSLNMALRTAGMVATDVEHLPTHGGSLRAYVQDLRLTPSKDAVRDLLLAELDGGLQDLDTYLAFAAKPPQVKRAALRALVELEGRVVGYGASAKAATMLNYLGVGPELIEAVVDVTPAKRGKYLPGCRIPIHSEAWLEHNQPDVVINHLWNWREESEERIRKVAPDAQIVYLNQTGARVD